MLRVLLRRFKFIFFVLILVWTSLPFSQLFAQFSGYQLSEGSAYNSALSSQGIGLNDSASNLTGNPAFFAFHGKHIIEAGAAGSRANSATGPVLLNGGGYYQFTPALGMGIRFKPIYHRFFPSDERFVNYTGQAIVTYKLNELFSMGFALGPSVSNRPGGFSSYSWNATGMFAFHWESLSIGVVLESPGANRFEAYLGTESLKERYPERASIGIKYELTSALFIYGELHRLFWERSMFSQNGLEERPGFPVRTMYNGSLGIGYKIMETTDLLFGGKKDANPTTSGVLDPVYGVSVGIKNEIFPSVFGKGLYGSIYLQRTGVFKPNEPFVPETSLGFQVHSVFDRQIENPVPPKI